MISINSKITVLFEDPFWVAIYERECEDKLEVSRIVFGAEPKDYDVYEFFLKHWDKLKFSPPLATFRLLEKKKNPKRIQREIEKGLHSSGIGTKAQQALKKMQEQNKTVRKTITKEQREAEKIRQFELRHDKRKEKHKGH